MKKMDTLVFRKEIRSITLSWEDIQEILILHYGLSLPHTTFHYEGQDFEVSFTETIEDEVKE